MLVSSWSMAAKDFIAKWVTDIMNTRNLLSTINDSEIAANVESEEYSLDNSMGFAVVFKKTDSSLTNKIFSSVSLDAFSITNHGYKTGLKVRFTTSGTLPTGLLVLTDYYLIRVSDNVLMVASSQANALDGDYIALTGGSGTHTVSVQAFEPVLLKLKGTIDGEIWVDLPDSFVNIANEAQMMEHEAAYFHKVKAQIILGAGQYSVNCKIMIKTF